MPIRTQLLKKWVGQDPEKHIRSTPLPPDMELGHWVTGLMGHLGHLSRPGHRVTRSSF